LRGKASCITSSSKKSHIRGYTGGYTFSQAHEENKIVAERLLAIDEVAEMLGVTKLALYSWTHRSKIPYVKLGKRCLRFRESDILKWVADNASYPKGEEHPKVRCKRTPAKGAMTNGYVEGLIKRAKEEVLKK
jgi:excisionase family DNA binding protein